MLDSPLSFNKLFIVSILIIVICSFSIPTSNADVWTRQIVSQGNWPVEDYPGAKIVIDSSNNPHFLYKGYAYTWAGFEKYYRNYHDWYDGQQWHHENIATLLSSHCYDDLAIDSDDRLHMVYYDGLRYTKRVSDNWEGEVLPRPAADSHSKPRILADDNGCAHIWQTGYDFTTDIRSFYYMTNVSGSWTVEEVLPSVASSSIAGVMDSANQIHFIAFVEPGGSLPTEIKHVTKVGGVWQEETVATTTDTYPSTAAAIDNFDHLYVIQPEVDTGLLRYFDNTSGSWRQETVFQNSPEMSLWYDGGIYLDSTGEVRILFSVVTSEDPLIWGFYYAQGSYGNWQIDPLGHDVDKYGTINGMVLDETDTFHASSFDPNDALIYSHGDVTSWQHEVVVRDGYTKTLSRLMLDSNDAPCISYVDAFKPSGHVEYDVYEITAASGDGSNWTYEQVPSEGEFSQYLNFDSELDSSENLHVFYKTEDDVYHTHNSSGTWQHDMIVENDYWQCLSSAIDLSDELHLVTSKWPRDIYHAYEDVVGWNYETVRHYDDGGIYGRVKIATDIYGDLHVVNICEVSYNQYELHYARKASGSWQYETIETNVSDIASPEIVVDGFGNVHVCYYHETDRVMRYGKRSGGSWQISTIPTDGRIGSYVNSSIGTDSGGDPYICYVEEDSLMLAYYTSGAWQFEQIDSYVSSDGGIPSLQIDASDYVHISYYDGVCVMYATNSVPQPVIAVEPTSMNFMVLEGDPNSQVLTISNDGTGPLNINSITMHGPDVGKFSLGSYTTPLPASGVCLVQVNLDASTAGTFDASLHISCDDPANTIVEIPLHAYVFALPSTNLFCKVNSVDFGQVEVGQTSDTASLRFQNKSTTTTLTVRAIMLNNTNFSCQAPPVPISLEPLDSFIAEVTFEPQTVGIHDGMLDVYTIYDPLRPQPAASVALTGEGTPETIPDISITPDQYYFTSQQIQYCSEPIEVVIKNNGTADLNILDITDDNVTGWPVDPDGGTGPVGSSYPVTIQPGKSRTFTVTFCPQELGESSTEVCITSDDPDTHKYNLTFGGNGTHWNICDFNIDLTVDMGDLCIMAQQWLGSPSVPSADVAPEAKLDDVINLLDFAVFSQEWLKNFNPLED